MGAFLVKRGLWLILIECVVISLAITFDPFYHVIVLQVIWVTGIGMVVLGLLIWSKLPVGFIFLLGLCIVAGHNLLDYPEAARHQQVGFWWDLLHHGAFSKYTITGDHSILILYAIVPWMGIMLLGYCLGSWYRPSFDAKRRRSRLLWLGLSMTCLFVIIRLFNGYGDPHLWAMQRSPLISFLSFMNVTKYPPSLAYTCITLGPALVFLSLAEGIKNKITDFLTIFGRVPFFFYIIHFYVIHTLNVIIFFLSGYGIRDIGGPNTLIKFAPNQFSLSLGAVYVIWFFVILLMYPLCRRYNNYKNTNSHWWLRYL